MPSPAAPCTTLPAGTNANYAATDAPYRVVAACAALLLTLSAVILW